MGSMMAYEIEYSWDAERHIKRLPARWRKTIKAKAETKLKYEPSIQTRNRKPLRQPNALNVDWELRLQPYRVYYNVDKGARVVEVVAVGYKPGNDVFIDGVRIEL